MHSLKIKVVIIVKLYLFVCFKKKNFTKPLIMCKIM